MTPHRPDPLNATTLATFAELAAAFEGFRADDAVRAAALAGAGEGFRAGHNLDAAGEFPDMRTEEMLAPRDSGWRALHAVYTLPKSALAAVRGPAVGGGFSLSLAADIRVVGSSGRFLRLRPGYVLVAGPVGQHWVGGRAALHRAAGARRGGRGSAWPTGSSRTALDGEAVSLAASIAEHAPWRSS